METNERTIQQCWETARAVADLDPALWREDACGAWLRRDQYGSESGEFAWRLVNVSAGGPDTAEHLAAMHRDNGYDRSSGVPVCRVTADRRGAGATARLGEPANRPV